MFIAIEFSILCIQNSKTVKYLWNGVMIFSDISFTFNKHSISPTISHYYVVVSFLVDCLFDHGFCKRARLKVINQMQNKNVGNFHLFDIP